MDMDKWLEFARGFVRPYVAYLSATVFAGLAGYLTVRFANEDIARTIIVGFVSIVSIVIGFYFGQRQRPQ